MYKSGLPDMESMKAHATAMRERVDNRIAKKTKVLEVGVQEPSQEDPSLTQLGSATILEIELMATKRQLAATQAELQKMRYAQALKTVQELELEQQELLARIQAQVGKSGNITLVDRAKGLVRIG